MSCVRWCLWRSEEDVRSPMSCEPSNMGAGDRIWVLCTSSNCSCLTAKFSFLTIYYYYYFLKSLVFNKTKLNRELGEISQLIPNKSCPGSKIRQRGGGFYFPLIKSSVLSAWVTESFRDLPTGCHKLLRSLSPHRVLILLGKGILKYTQKKDQGQFY